MNHDEEFWRRWLEYNYSSILFNDDESIDFNGDVHLNHLDLTHIPFKFNKVNGSFDCSYNNLTSLENCPNILKGNMYIRNNTFFNVKSLLEKEIYRVLQWYL